MSKPRKWNTNLLAAYGLFAGSLVGWYSNYQQIHVGGDYFWSGLGAAFGTGIVVAGIVAIASGVRNLFVR